MKVVKKDSKKVTKKKDKLNRHIIEKLTLNKKSSKIKKKPKTEVSSEPTKEVLNVDKEKLHKSKTTKRKSDSDKTNNVISKADTSPNNANAKKSKNKITTCSSNWKILEEQLNKGKAIIKKETFKRKSDFSNGFNENKKLSKFDKDIWFDNVDTHDLMLADKDELKPSSGKGKSKKIPMKEDAKTLIKKNAFGGLTKVVGMDCEMVGVGERGRQSVLARVSLVNQFGKCIYDKFVKAREEVTDYRTFVSGVRPQDLVDAPDFEVVQKEVADILQGRILVGHALWNDFKVLFLDHPKRCIRDTAKYIPFKTMTGGRSPALRVLSAKILGVQVQKGEHSSIQDAQAAMRLYTMHKREWEAKTSTPKLSKKAKKNLNTAKVLENSSLTA